jgi:trehalose 6-phosphate phosphatase
MTPPLDQAIDQLLHVYGKEQIIALLFDYDGTLTPIVEHPSLARLDDKTAYLLERLASRPRVGVGVISSRMLTDLKQLICIPKVQFAGVNGLEMEFNGLTVHHPCAQEGMYLMSEVASGLHAAIEKFSGSWLENKRLGLTVHFRAVASESQSLLQSAVFDSLYPFRYRVNMTQGPMAIEITPNLGWSKNTAVRIMAQSFGAPGQGILYAGDCANDADAFAAVTAMEGVTIGVGLFDSQTIKYTVPDPDALYNFMAALDYQLNTGHKIAGKNRSIHVHANSSANTIHT